MKKTFLAVLMAALLLLPSCGEQAPVYRTDLSAEAVSDACTPVLSSADLLSAADPDYIQYRLLLDDTMMENCVVYIQNAGTSLDEFGIIKALTDDTSALEAAVADFLTRRNEEWTGQYMVEEYPKLEAAEYKTIGRYVIYAILSEEDKAAFFAAAEQFIAE